MLFGKIDSLGNVAWIKTYGGDGDDRIGEFVQDNAGNFYLIGYTTSSFGAGTEDGLIIKVDSNGNKIWDKSFGLSGIERLRSGVMDATNALFVTGFSNSFGTQKDVIVMKLDTAGAVTWSQRYASNRIDKGQGIILDGIGNIIVAGQSTMDLFISTSELNPFLMKLNPSGNQIWTKIYEDSVQSSAFDLIHGQGSGYVLAGESYVLPGDTDTLDCFFMQTDDNGSILWSNFAGGAGDESTPRVRITSDGGYLGTSATTSFVSDTMNNIYLIKMDAAGNSGCNTMSHLFNEIDTTFTETSLSLTSGSGSITGTRSWIGITAPFVPDTLCQTIVVGLEPGEDSRQVPVLYPNPAGTQVFIDSPAGRKEISLYTSEGTRIQVVQSPDRIIRLDLAGLPSGKYLVHITGESGTWTQRLVIE